MPSDLKTWWLSSLRMTVFASVDSENVVKDASPVIRKSIGQSLFQLESWLAKQGGFKKRLLPDD